jgi:hypothetical protein
MSLTDYPAHEWMPRNLSKEEIQNPYGVIYAFFDYANLPRIRQMLWEWLKITINENWHTLSNEQRADALYFYEKLEKLVEAAHLIHRNVNNKS